MKNIPTIERDLQGFPQTLPLTLSLVKLLALEPESQRVEELVNDLLGQDRKKIILDLTAVEYIDSTGLGAIVHCFSAAGQAGGLRPLPAFPGSDNHYGSWSDPLRELLVPPTA